ncbi:MAG TPA: cell division protein FtsI [Syntrophomonadaceae bacterium]|nr:cell division protein FtsI [Syntrophomonadaceae bacterium]
MQDTVKKFLVFITVCFLIYAGYLIHLVMVRGPALSKHGANPRPWIIENRVVRGGIYARNGEKITDSTIEGDKITRKYYYPLPYAHLTGYHSRRLGKTGLERAYDKELLGQHGHSKRNLEARWGIDRTEGENIYLTIDHELQLKAWELMSPYKGAAVVLDPRNGEILAMVSTPSFDPNNDSLEKNWDQLRQNSGHPLLNRSSQGLYPPGSVMKIVTAAVGLDKFPQLGNEYFNCQGEITIQGRVLHDLRVHGSVDLKRAMALSCNCYFANLGMDIGSEDFTNGLKDFGWGEKIPFDLSVERSPLKKDSLQSPNALAESAMGQGEILVSPLFMALIAGSIGNQGVMMTPYLVQDIRSPEDRVVWKQGPRILRLVAEPEAAWQVQEAMMGVVRSGGTGSAASLPGINVAGKTGSAENPSGPTHAWFVASAPAEQPRAAVSVIVEHGGQGGTTAAPIAKELLRLALLREG